MRRKRGQMGGGYGGANLGGNGEEGVDGMVVVVFVIHKVLCHAGLGQEVEPYGLAELLDHQVLQQQASVRRRVRLYLPHTRTGDLAPKVTSSATRSE
jgi:hypothetical protein